MTISTAATTARATATTTGARNFSRYKVSSIEKNNAKGGNLTYKLTGVDASFYRIEVILQIQLPSTGGAMNTPCDIPSMVRIVGPKITTAKSSGRMP